MSRQGTAMLTSPAVCLPDNLATAWQVKQELGPEASFIAGGTLMQPQWQKGVDCPRYLISLEQIDEMQGCEKTIFNGEAGIRMGALTTLAACKDYLAYFNQFPLLEEAVRNVAAPAIRNRATIGGNIAGRFGDLIPALLVLDATLSLYDGSENLHKPFSDWISEGSTTDGFIIAAIYVPHKKIDTKSFFFKKVGYREAFTPSIVTISGCCQFNSQNVIEYIRLAAGGGTTPYQRLTGCERLVEGLTLSNDLLQTLYQGIKEEFNTTTDTFTTAAYKKTVAANMIVSKIASFAG
jgi:xanthine dehydrogenase small subunit